MIDNFISYNPSKKKSRTFLPAIDLQKNFRIGMCPPGKQGGVSVGAEGGRGCVYDPPDPLI